MLQRSLPHIALVVVIVIVRIALAVIVIVPVYPLTRMARVIAIG